MASKSVWPYGFEFAHGAIVLFVVVGDHMFGQVAFSSELLIANGTFERFLARVDAKVTFQLGRTDKLLVANVAHVTTWKDTVRGAYAFFA